MKDKAPLQLSDSANSKIALLDDRRWFKQNLGAVVRFRPEIDHEFAPLLRHGSMPPQFIPSHLTQSSPLSWVAVVNLQRMLGASIDQTEIGQLRLRIKTIAMPQIKDQRLAEKELTRAIATELLLHTDQNLKTKSRPVSHDTDASQSQAA